MITLAYQGAAGAYSFIAGKYLFPEASMLGFKTFEDVFNSVIKGNISFALLPVDNTVIGSIFEVYDLLYKHPQLAIKNEIMLKINHNLLGVGQIKQIKKVYSHPKALAQCNDLFKNYSFMKPVVYEDTAKAASKIARKNNPQLAAIASLTAAREYGLKVLKAKIQNNDQNYTRFLLLKRLDTTVETLQESKVWKTSLVFVASHTPGALLSCMTPFATHSLNLTKIESRPLVGSPWQYLFYLDFEHGKLNGELENILEEVKPHTLLLRKLGTYPKGVTIEERKFGSKIIVEISK